MKRLVLAAWAIVVFLLGSPLQAQPAPPQRITLLQTSDLHAYIYPYDYYQGREADVGLARVATLVEEVRAEGQPVLLLDAGDTIQGSPVGYYHHRKHARPGGAPGPPDPMMLTMNHLRFDAMAVGNHEFNFGLASIESARHDASFPWLSANVVRDDGTPFFTPYLVKDVNGVRVGILGLITPNVPNWESPENYAGLTFLDTVETARRYVPLLREKEGADVVVVVTHQGLERDLLTNLSNETEYENQAYRLTRDVPGIDVVLLGHSHQQIEPQEVNGVVVCEPGRWGDSLCRVDLYIERGVSGDVRVGRWEGALLETAGVEPNRDVLDLARPYHDRTMAYINSVVGEAEAAISAERARFQDTPMMDLLQQVMLEASGAQLSMAALLPYRFDGIDAGPITVRELFSFYVYDNTLVVVEVSGRDVKEALEHSARYYQAIRPDPETGELLIEPNPAVRAYNFDMLAGAHYRIDPTRPVGERIQELSYQGREMDPDETFKLVTTNYRAAGGGGYRMLKNADVLWRSSEEVRNLLIEHIREQGTISPFCDYNWRVAPDATPGTTPP
ncbi:MAG: bifunctional metallophosphatase/5'-nucleotidase [Vicinamibacteria bacterium]